MIDTTNTTALTVKMLQDAISSYGIRYDEYALLELGRSIGKLIEEDDYGCPPYYKVKATSGDVSKLMYVYISLMEYEEKRNKKWEV
jgi:hypothetical protein|nr:MAG TPA: hypothetical protein [Caudoviricetes sp.]